MGPEIALARSASAAGRQSGDRPRGHEQGAVPRLLQDHQQHRSLHLRRITGSRPTRCTTRQRRRNCLPRPAIGNGFDAGLLYCDSSYANMAEVSLDNLAAIGIRAKLQPIERAGFFAGYAEQEIHAAASSKERAPHSAMPRPGWAVRRQGRRASPMAAIPISTSSIRSRPTRSTTTSAAAILDKMQQLVYEKAMYAPIWQLAFINGVGPRVGEFVVRPDPGLCLYRAVRGHHDQDVASPPRYTRSDARTP